MLARFSLSILLFASASVAAAATTDAPKKPAATAAAPLAIGETFTIDSAVLGEQRQINVYVPPGYAEGDARYAVLYMADGGINEDFPHIVGAVDVSVKNGVMRPLIVVGIPNVERRRDLLSASAREEDRKIAPHAGGADKFRRFIRDELKPLIAQRYRTTSESALIGESLAGLFVLETLMTQPDLFDTYIGVSPALWWNDRALARGMTAKLESWNVPGKRVWFASASDDIVEATEVAAVAFRTVNPPKLPWHYEAMTDQKHSTIFPVAALKALRTLFPPLTDEKK